MRSSLYKPASFTEAISDNNFCLNDSGYMK